MKKLKAATFGLLPQASRYDRIRRHTKYEFSPPEGIRFKIAETGEELTQAFRLVHDAYVTHGYMNPHPSGMRLTKYHMLPTTSTLIALEGTEVIGTASLIRSCPFGLPCETAYDLTPLKTQRARIAEISALAIHPKYSHRKGFLLWPLLKFTYEYSAHYFGVDYFVMVVSPQWFEFYAATWFFEPFDNRTIQYDYVNGVSGRGGFTALRHLKTKGELIYRDLKPENNCHRYIFETSFDCFEFPSRHPSTISDPVMTPDLLSFFFKEQSNIISDLSDIETRILRHLYNTEAFDRVLPFRQNPISDIQFGEKRFEVECPTHLVLPGNRQIPIQVRSVSKSGVGAISYRQLRSGEEYVLKIDTAKHKTLTVHGVVVWRKEDGACGFHITKASRQWEMYIKSLDQNLLRPA